MQCESQRRALANACIVAALEPTYRSNRLDGCVSNSMEVCGQLNRLRANVGASLQRERLERYRRGGMTGREIGHLAVR
jgi:hypothetical protein